MITGCTSKHGLRHYENLKPHVSSPEDWCIPQNMKGLEYLLVEPACEANEKAAERKTMATRARVWTTMKNRSGFRGRNLCERRLERSGAGRGAEVDGTRLADDDRNQER